MEDRWKWHPYGPFNQQQGFMYIDRIGYRLPSELSQSLGELISDPNLSKKKKKKASMQRSLTPHLDCCPTSLFPDSATRWRPIQCFVSLTDSLEPNTGGFEIYQHDQGLHRIFDEWVKNRPPTIITKNSTEMSIPAPCLGNYSHIRPTEDAEVMQRVGHVPVAAGSAVFWDVRMAHANAYRHEGTSPRAVVYCSFLPNVPLNRDYALNTQLVKFLAKKPQTDQWNHIVESEENNDMDCSQNYSFSPLGRKLIGLDPW